MGGTDPHAVVGLLSKANVASVQGMMDRHAALFSRRRNALFRKYPEDLEAIARTHEQLSGDDIEYLLSLPKSRTLSVEGLRIVVCHGTPASQSDALREDDPPHRFQRQRERAAAPDLIVCGQTPAPFVREVDGTLFVNPGSVGIGPEACYALIDTDAEPWEVRFEPVSCPRP